MTPMTSSATPHAPVAVLAGPAGAGKTTVARALSAHLRASLLDLDTATAPLVSVVAGLLGSDDLDGAVLAEATRDARYETLLALAEDCLACGTPAVLVAPFTRERRDPAAWAGTERRLREAGGLPRLVWVHASRAVLRERLRGRGAARDASKLADLDAHLDGLDLRPPAVGHLPVDTGLPVRIEELAAALGGRVRTASRP